MAMVLLGPVCSWKGPDDVLLLMRPTNSEFGEISLSIGELLALHPNVKPYGDELRSFWTSFQTVWSPVACDLYWGNCIFLEAV